MSTIDPFGSLALGGALVGPGSQPTDEDGGVLEYMEMPSAMMTFATPNLPEPEDAAGLEEGLARLDSLLQLLVAAADGAPGGVVELAGLDAANLELINQVLGEGEVSVIAGTDWQAQEAVLAGVWRVRRTTAAGAIDTIEVGAFPSGIRATVFQGARSSVAMPEQLGPNIFNAPPLVPEINEHIAKSEGASEPHVINLSLLPHTEEDLTFLNEQLGRGDVTILSRGYGNCRITSTQTRNTWWVQYYNSQDTLILNSIEIGEIPDVACAALEDLGDSAERLGEILEVYR
ncbi:hydrogenase expression/formation protein [Roseibium sediminis]|uniref:hydrogenase expression/formation protein n=1 Tax=Roseibium sediminis TaxID=1775174 RepID=UPI00123D8690|nr:hydrogenase expression/formation protein [Roseibium sediminis]